MPPLRENKQISKYDPRFKKKENKCAQAYEISSDLGLPVFMLNNSQSG